MGAMFVIAMGVSTLVGSFWSLVRSFTENDWVWFVACLLLGPVASLLYSLVIIKRYEGQPIGKGFASTAAWLLGVPVTICFLIGVAS